MDNALERTLQRLGAHRGVAIAAWVLLAIAFYVCGQWFTVWLLEPENFPGGWYWLAVAGFPLLLPISFLAQRHLGCASGRCGARGCSLSP